MEWTVMGSLKNYCIIQRRIIKISTEKNKETSRGEYRKLTIRQYIQEMEKNFAGK